jgi:hypothetical protein
MRRMGVGIVFLACAVCVPALFSQDNYKVVNGPEKFYYGHVSLVEILNDGKDPVVLRTGADQPIPAVLNLPLGPGDTLRTSDARRLEIQFDNATIVRLDLNTELKIETILARSLSRRETSMTNLVLERGRICVMYKEYDHTELFQVLTPNAAVKLRHNSVATITAGADGASDIQVDFGRATAMFGPDEKELYQAVASRNERLVIDQSGQATTGGLAPDPDFASWNAAINKDFEALHEGKSSLPKPLIRGVTKATFYFAQTFGDRYGEWLYDDLYGYVWRPYYNDYYPGGTWRPYYYGRWVGMAGQMFWIPSEPWGWIPYHLGVWQWDAKRGWFWLPGSAFAPAWVDWAFFNGTYFAWIPWSFYDWMYDGGGWGYFGSYGGYYPVGGYPYFVGTDEEPSVRKGVNVVSRNQLKKPSGSSVLPMPKEFKRVLRAVENAVKRGDSRVIDSLRAGLQPTLLAREKTINPPKVPDRGGLGTTTLARPSWRVSRALEGMIAPTAPLKTRGVDWNPDVRIGQRLGVNIRYSSRTNEIVCPELRLSSAMMGRGVLAAERPRSSGGSVVASGGSMSTGSGGGSTSAGSSGASSSSSGGGGGHIR